MVEAVVAADIVSAVAPIVAHSLLLTVGLRASLRNACISCLILAVSILLFLSLLQQAPRDAVPAAMAVDAIVEATAAVHILSAGAATAATATTPLCAVAASAALDAVVEAVVAADIVSAVAPIVAHSLLLTVGLRASLRNACISCLILAVSILLFLSLLQQAPRDAVPAAMAVDAIVEAAAAVHILSAGAATATTATTPLCAVAASAALDAVVEAVVAADIVSAVAPIVAHSLLLTVGLRASLRNACISCLILAVSILLFLSLLQQAPRDAVPAAMAVDAIVEATAAVHILSAGAATAATATTTPPHFVQ